ncbi:MULTISPECIES: hybrid sensor histidine kinase/response regulator transcription factor [Bacillus cereus group]|uniref:helix-turn-helix transcriptional regulator n=1 Tax=Bacillus cereus group TaxID=86661 RepID=UPI000B408257|nr:MULTISPECIES: hybrid sensor histidine kinase/response regulator transcription factor [Bacillus cereus group]ARX67044.1 histidine kinase [Bacillus thuringiensis]MDA2066396.1 hybrid sensor histidine kinase/response regulator transcription factor [Bacillus cereus]MDA2078757.1 hybrid sensor histidine kinase/response regulator transcription factor [Bacillus cereus]MDA2084471.1 hybrid sensor histidine kinase/response regulator transcription factor [Bacillus cereus]MEB9692582.1 hybrid sensor histi
MLDMVKYWFWYDWIMLGVRLLASVSIILATLNFQDGLTLPLWIIILWEIIAFSIPWVALLFNYKYYLFTEILLYGGICIYLTSLFPEAYNTFLISVFLIAANSKHLSYYWTAPITVFITTGIFYAIAPSNSYWIMVTYYGFAYVMGFAFHLLIVNHKQNESIRKQNAVLEQYMSQIERITLAEERNRLSSELHDTVGHAYTSIIMGMETLRTELATEMGIQRLDSLLEMGRKSIEDVRGYLHQMESPCQSPSLIQSLQNLGAEFQEHAQVNVSFRTYGEEYELSRQTKIAFIRCLQESLTNAVRHGQGTEIIVSLQFEQQYTRLEVQDNGKGNVEWQEGFGMNTMKERAMNLQGQLSVYTKPDEGMLVTCTIPRQTEIKDGLIRLLIVDDQPFVRESLRTLLDRYEDLNVVGLAEDGNEAIDLCGRLQPHVILMDLDMQHMDGVEATKKIKQQWPHIRILIFTTFQDTEQALESLRNGADGFLLKSIETLELANTIRLIHKGGTLIDQGMSHKIFEKFDAPKETPQSKATAYELTAREIEILQLVAKGLRYTTIASRLYLSNGTVRNYASTAYTKLGVRNKEEAVQKALEIGIIE